MYYELSKPEKKIARACIDKGLQAEYKVALDKANQILADWENTSVNNQDSYLCLFKAITLQDDKIGRRYNDLGGSRYLITVAQIFHEGQINEEDLKGFSEDARQKINSWVSFWKEDEETTSSR